MGVTMLCGAGFRILGFRATGPLATGTGATAFGCADFLAVDELADEPDEGLTGDCAAVLPLEGGFWDEEEEEEASAAAMVDADCMVGGMVGAENPH